jgi:hypothetical protein
MSRPPYPFDPVCCEYRPGKRGGRHGNCEGEEPRHKPKSEDGEAEVADIRLRV